MLTFDMNTFIHTNGIFGTAISENEKYTKLLLICKFFFLIHCPVIKYFHQNCSPTQEVVLFVTNIILLGLCAGEGGGTLCCWTGW